MPDNYTMELRKTLATLNVLLGIDLDVMGIPE